MDAKLLVQLTFAIPTSILCAVLLSIAFGGSIWMFVVPLAYSLVIAVASLFINAKFPCLDWDNASVAVKQGSSTLICMLVTLVTLVLSAVLTVAVGQKFAQLAIGGLTLACVIFAVILYKKLIGIRLNKIDEK
jgi:D-alanyl-lipoteichoic acid acyltransferase DltB (MBOAT superfamily)